MTTLLLTLCYTNCATGELAFLISNRLLKIALRLNKGVQYPLSLGSLYAILNLGWPAIHSLVRALMYLGVGICT